MEAMACGTPVVATHWHGPTEFVNPANGYLIDIEDQLMPTPCVHCTFVGVACLALTSAVAFACLFVGALLDGYRCS
jgi:hypothetical protein